MKRLLEFIGAKSKQFNDEDLLDNVPLSSAETIGKKISKGKTPDEIICEIARRHGGDYEEGETEFGAAVREIKKCARHMGLSVEK